MAEKTILKTVEQFKDEFQRAQDTFARDGRALESRANRTVMTFDQINTAFDMIHEGARITAEFFASCEVIVLSLDEICRPLLEQKPGIKAVKAVLDLIEKVNDTVAETNTNFTISLNGSAKSDVGALQPVASMQALVIQKFWDSYYHRMPEYADAQKEEKAKLAEKKVAAKSQEDNIRNQEKKNSELRAKADELTQTHMEQVTQFETMLEAAIYEKTAQRKKEIAEATQKLQNELTDAQTTLSNLGFFKFAEKKAMRQQIEALEAEIARMTDPQYGMDAIEQQKAAAKDAVSKYRMKVEEFCDQFVTVRTECIAIPRAEPLPSRKACTKDEKAILNEMIEDVNYNASDLVILVNSPSFPNTQRMTPILSGLVSRGYLEKDYDCGRSVYRLASEEKWISYEVITLNKKHMEAPCPQPPTVESVLSGSCK